MNNGPTAGERVEVETTPSGAVKLMRVTDLGTGVQTELRLIQTRRRGRKPKVKTLHRRFVSSVIRPAPRGSVRYMIDGRETPVEAGGAPRPPFDERVQRRTVLLARRGMAQSAEDAPPHGQASLWLADVALCVPRTGQLVARQLARLCGDDSQVTISSRSLADAVGHRDRAGRQRAFTERGLRCLVDAGWITAETSGRGPESLSTYRLLPGDLGVDYYPDDDDAWAELRGSWGE